MKVKTHTSFETWSKRDYKNRRIVGIYQRDVYDWLITQASPDMEIYSDRELRHMSFVPVAVGVDDRLYSMLTLKWA